MFGARADSRYNGAFFYENDRMFKVIDEIRVSPEVNSINHELWRTFRTRGKLREMFYMPIGANALIYEVSEATDIELVLDMRESYDLPKFGRDYAIEETNGYVIITYAQNGKEPIYLVIKKDDLAFETIGLWEQTAYSADKKRNPHQEDLYVYRALKTKAKQLVMTFGHDLERAIRENNLVCNKLPLLEKKAVQYTISVCHGRKVSKHYTDAYRSALFAYDQLIVNGAKQFAGLPWFFQYWSRDELISVIGLMESGRFDEALGVLDRYLDLIQSDGRLPNRYPHSDLASADAIGWLFKRYGDYMHKAYTRVDRHLSGADYGKFLDNLEIACNNLARHHMREGLAYNASNETWMDTTAGNDHREGFRIEIQALFLQMFHVMFGITKNHKYKRMEDELKARVRADFFDGGRLADGKGDFTQRPNVFIAAYVYPELLSKEEWKKVFRNALSALWLSWGGLATIDKKHHLFCATYTGEDNRSYHRGDSWYYVNNMAAIAMHRISPGEFQKEIYDILEGSAREILKSGVIGCHAEVSSASVQSSDGCLSQLWSNALFIELMHEIFK